jgi:hypothetical protein
MACLLLKELRVAKHIALPPLSGDKPAPKTFSPPTPTPPAAKASPPKAGPPNSLVDVSKTDGVASFDGIEFYLMKVSMEGSSFAGFTILVHRELFTEKQLQGMASEAAAEVLTHRIKKRRAILRENREYPKDVASFNAEGFRQDVEFFEVVMCDKFGFRVLRTANCSGTLEPTIKT